MKKIAHILVLALAATIGISAAGIAGAQTGNDHSNTTRTDNQRRQSREQRTQRREERRDAIRDTFTGWDRLGERTVTSERSNDTITFASSDHRYDRVRLHVERNSIVLSDVVVTFADGGTYSPNVQFTFSEDHSSYEFQLPGGNRSLARVDFRYSELPQGQNAQIEVWAR